MGSWMHKSGALLLVVCGCAGGDSSTAGLPGAPTPASSTTAAGSTSSGEAIDDDDGVGGASTGGGMDESTGASTTTADVTSGGESSESSGGEDGSTGPEPGVCMPDNACATATAIGGVAGDEASTNVTDGGSDPTWVVIQVSEQSSSVVGEELTVTITLQSIGGDFDINAFLGPPGGSSACGGQAKSSAEVGAPDSVHFEWGEGGVANNDDDGAYVAVEVVAKNATCVPGGSWTLTAIGDS